MTEIEIDVRLIKWKSSVWGLVQGLRSESDDSLSSNAGALLIRDRNARRSIPELYELSGPLREGWLLNGATPDV